ncbi:MAG: hypothetical protein F4X65_14665 [Chloroflexi bacterium]|nr:hypothetical protein [Chloroflexota bacterium]
MFIPPNPPDDVRFLKAESDYRRERAKGGGFLGDLAASLEVLLKFLWRVVKVMARPLVLGWQKYRARNASR